MILDFPVTIYLPSILILLTTNQCWLFVAMKVGGLRIPQSAAKYHVSRAPASKPADPATVGGGIRQKKGCRLAALLA
jgi:hypothetical protein